MVLYGLSAVLAIHHTVATTDTKAVARDGTTIGHDKAPPGIPKIDHRSTVAAITGFAIGTFVFGLEASLTIVGFIAALYLLSRVMSRIDGFTVFAFAVALGLFGGTTAAFATIIAAYLITRAVSFAARFAYLNRAPAAGSLARSWSTHTIHNNGAMARGGTTAILLGSYHTHDAVKDRGGTAALNPDAGLVFHTISADDMATGENVPDALAGTTWRKFTIDDDCIDGGGSLAPIRAAAQTGGSDDGNSGITWPTPVDTEDLVLA